VSGAVISASAVNVPTGPTIVLAATTFVLVSMAFAPRRGLVWAAFRQRRSRREIRADAVLEDLFRLARQHEDVTHGHAVAVLEAMAGGRRNVARSLAELEERGLAARLSDGTWSITPAGLSVAENRWARSAADA
jgi:manganese/zinc/iron transport system permease protein